MRLKYRTKFILTMVCITCIGLVSINVAFHVKDIDYIKVEEETSRIIIESPKKPSFSDNKEVVDEEGTRITAPSTHGEPRSPVQPLPLPDPNAPILITPLS